MSKENQILKLLQLEADNMTYSVSGPDGNWIVKGFIDIAKNIYTISDDTKVISKILELLLFPKLNLFANENNLVMILSREQNFYPDFTLIDTDGEKYAVDIKSTYRKGDNTVNGMTLGAFTGYFRDRNSNKNITFPYNEYRNHLIFGIIYTRTSENSNQRRVFSLDDLINIPSVIHDIKFFVQEKYKIATDRPGSGNTKNIGSITNINDLINGNGVFAELGEKVFNDYWMNYLTNDMARAAELAAPFYSNISEYKAFKNIQ